MLARLAARPLRPATALLAPLLLTPALAAQQVWVVDDQPGPGVDFVGLPDAVQAAASGDVLLVRSGSYQAFTVSGKGLTVAADFGAAVSVGGPGASASTRVESVPVTERVVLRGLSIRPGFDPAAQAWLPGLVLDDCDGLVWLEACSITGGVPATSIVDCDRVVFAFTTASGSAGFHDGATSHLPGDGLRVVTSTLSLQGGAVRGGDGLDGLDGFAGAPTVPSQNGGVGVRLIGSSLWAGSSEFRGGAGGDGFAVLEACAAPMAGGTALLLGTVPGGPLPLARLADVALAGGPGGAPGPVCPSPGPTGAASQVAGGYLVSWPDPPPLLGVKSPVREGQVLDATVYDPTSGGLSVGLLAFGTSAGFLPDIGLHGVIALLPPAQFVVLGLIPAAGKGASLLVPELGPGFTGVELFLQPAACDALGCRIGTPSAVLLIDSGF